jgi:hypothetical protein
MEPEKMAARRLSKHVPVATNTHAAMEALDAVFSMRSVSHQTRNTKEKGKYANNFSKNLFF